MKSTRLIALCAAVPHGAASDKQFTLPIPVGIGSSVLTRAQIRARWMDRGGFGWAKVLSKRG